MNRDTMEIMISPKKKTSAKVPCLKRRVHLSFILVISVLFFTAQALAITNTIYVDGTAAGANNGTSWTDAYTDFQDGIDGATGGDEVWVAAGTYMPASAPNIPSPANDRYFHFSMKNGVAVYGGFAGWESSKSERNIDANETILSCDLGTADDYADNCYHVFYHPSGLGLTTTAILEDFTITSGNANGSDPHDDGGGMYNHDNSPSITRCIFENNWAENGGGMRNWASSPVITYSTFSGNVAKYTYGRGGAMFIQNGTPDVSTTTFSNNTAKEGGAISTYFATSPIFSECTFNNNSAGIGGAIVNNFSSSVLTNCTFAGNTITGFYEGRAIYNVNGGSPVITNSTFTGHSGYFTMFSADNSSVPVVKNSIFWDDSLDQAIGIQVGNTATIVTYSVVRNSTVYPGTGNSNSNPLLDGSGLQDNGGPVYTVAIGAAGSAVNGATTSGAPTIDARELSRDGSDGFYDIGAYELISYNVTPSVSGGNGTTSPAGVFSVPAFNTTQITLVPDTGYHADQVTGTCGGNLSGNTYTTNAIIADCTVIASFAINTYTVTSSVSGGNGTITPLGDQIVNYNATPSFTLTPNTGYHIAGVTGTCGGTLVSNTYTTNGVTADCTVIASFAINTYTVTSSVSGGNGTITPLGDQAVNHGSTASFTVTPTTGYHIDQVAGTCGGTLVGDSYTTDPVTAPCTVIASFAINTYTVTSSVPGGNGTITPLGDQTVDYGDTPAFTLTPAGGYHIEEVTGTCGGTLIGNTFTTNPVTTACTVIANFSDTYTVTSSVSGGNGTITPLGAQTVQVNDTPSFTLTPDTGYHIDSVTGTCGGTLVANTFTTDPVTISCTVIANFSINTYTVNSSVSGGNGTISPSGDITKEHGSTQAYTLTPDGGYHVDTVTGTCGGTLVGNTYTTDPITSACTVVGSFTDQYTLQVLFTGQGSGSVSSAPAGINACTDDCSADFTDGQQVVLTATPGDKSKFGGWSGDGCSGTGDCTVTMDQARSITARFNGAFNWNLFLGALLHSNNK